MNERRPLDAGAIATMILLTSIWGFTQVAVKLAAADISEVMQGGLRSIVSLVLLLGWARWRGVPLFARDGTWWPGLLAGALYAGEFFFVYAGLAHTSASRMVVFVYLAPVLTAIGVHLFVSGEQLVGRQWIGVALAFAGIGVAFGDGFVASPASLLGDTFGIVAAFLWAATTVVIRTSALSRASASKTLLYQITIAALTLPLASKLIGEPGVIAVTVTAVASIAFQGIIVSFASHLAWFWLLTRFLAGRLAAFSSLAPLFGVLAGVVVLGEPLRGQFAVAAGLVILGIYLVNRRT
ncbi:MAG: DMT family transporter [Burkholderiales bacterium]|jgi:drug/metabolite transporter (DMT)-like permease